MYLAWHLICSLENKSICEYYFKVSLGDMYEKLTQKNGVKYLKNVTSEISENIKNGPKNLKNVSSENLGKNKELSAVGKSQRLL